MGREGKGVLVAHRVWLWRVERGEYGWTVIRFNRAEALRLLGRFDEAEAVLRDMVEFSERVRLRRRNGWPRRPHSGQGPIDEAAPTDPNGVVAERYETATPKQTRRRLGRGAFLYSSLAQAIPEIRCRLPQ